MNTNTLETSARTKLQAAEKNYGELLGTVESRLAALPETASADDVDRLTVEFRARLDQAEGEIESARKQLDSAQTIARGRAAMQNLIPAGDLSGSEPRTYDPRNPSGPSYFADLFAAQRTGSHEAIARLQRNNAEVAEARGIESRSVITTTDFYAPIWAGDQYVTIHRAPAGLCWTRAAARAAARWRDRDDSGVLRADSANPQAGDNAAVQTAAGTTSQLTAPVTTYGATATSRVSGLSAAHPVPIRSSSVTSAGLN
jgi:hypothetical protein